ncbi:hypothetical protein HPY42_02510 [Coprothermobacteraceae bacterium]|nr:hypothetical protein [Coprothermobacteraceae bacterium]
MKAWRQFFLNLLERAPAPIAVIGSDWQEAYEVAKEYTKSVSPRDLLVVQGETLGIDAVRDVIEFLSTVPGKGLRYVFVLQADDLTPEAQNAMLKTLEEPPRYARIVLFCNRWNSLLPTVRSRVFQLPLPPKTKADIQAKDAWEYLISSGSTTKLQELRKHEEWAKSVSRGLVLFDRNMDAYKIGAYYLELMRSTGKAAFAAELVKVENALQSNVSPEMIFDQLLLMGAMKNDILGKNVV